VITVILNSLPGFSRAALPLLMALLLGSAPVALADDLPDLGESARADFSPQIERKLGERIMNDIRLHEPSYVDDPEINDYLNRFGNQLVAGSSNPGGDFHFFAIRDNTVNAFAMFGGFIGVNTGTLLTAQSESELAGVVAHEISHVTQNHLARQISKGKQDTIATMIAMAVGILAARSNSQVASGVMASAQAGAIQSQLAYSRDFEREADRVGYQTLEKSGFDVRGMGDFFERLQKAGRVYENNAPVYMRSHPMTVERISDMQNRAQHAPYRQIVDSLDFLLVRAKLRAQAGTAREAVSEFEMQLREQKYSSEMAVRYSLSYALLRAKDVAGAQREMNALKSLKLLSPIISGLAAEIRIAAGDLPLAQAIYREALQRYPQSKSLVYGYFEALYAGRQYDQALRFLEAQLQFNLSDYRLYGMQAKALAASGKKMKQHRAQAEFYILQGQLSEAIEQLMLAQRASDGDFYEQSAVDARLRELRRQRAEEAKQKRSQ
jgi:predicted Zn-dependent protease